MYVSKAMKCRVCGNTVIHSYYRGFSICGKKCYNKWKWESLLDDKAIIIQGKCYHLKDYKELEYFNEKHFKIQMLDTGEIIETNNLWYEGDIPKEYMKPDNAVFLLKL